MTKRLFKLGTLLFASDQNDCWVAYPLYREFAPGEAFLVVAHVFANVNTHLTPTYVCLTANGVERVRIPFGPSLSKETSSDSST